MQALVARLTPEQLTKPVADGWTISATLAHLAFWDRRALLLIERFEREGFSPSPYDVHVVNDAMKPLCLAIAPQEAAKLAIETAETVDAKVESLSDEFIEAVIANGTPFNPHRSEHRRYHLDEIERALE